MASTTSATASILRLEADLIALPGPGGTQAVDALVVLVTIMARPRSLSTSWRISLPWAGCSLMMFISSSESLPGLLRISAGTGHLPQVMDKTGHPDLVLLFGAKPHLTESYHRGQSADAHLWCPAV